MPHHRVNLVCYYIQHLRLPLFLFDEHSCLTAVFPNVRVFPYHYAFFPGELPVAVVSSWQFIFPSEVDTTLFLRFEIHQHRLANLFAADIALSYNNRNCFRTSCSSRQLTTSRYVSCRVVYRCFYISDGDAFPSNLLAFLAWQSTTWSSKQSASNIVSI